MYKTLPKNVISFFPHFPHFEIFSLLSFSSITAVLRWKCNWQIWKWLTTTGPQGFRTKKKYCTKKGIWHLHSIRVVDGRGVKGEAGPEDDFEILDQCHYHYLHYHYRRQHHPHHHHQQAVQSTSEMLSRSSGLLRKQPPIRSFASWSSMDRLIIFIDR